MNDPRNTDHAWIETSARLFRIAYVPEARAGDDAAEARWFECNSVDELKDAVRALEGIEDPAQDPLYASHSSIIANALRMLSR